MLLLNFVVVADNDLWFNADPNGLELASLPITMMLVLFVPWSETSRDNVKRTDKMIPVLETGTVSVDDNGLIRG